MNRPERIQRPTGAIVVIALFALTMPLPSSHADQPPADVLAPPPRKGASTTTTSLFMRSTNTTFGHSSYEGHRDARRQAPERHP
jgi:hypothetical protein